MLCQIEAATVALQLQSVTQFSLFQRREHATVSAVTVSQYNGMLSRFKVLYESVRQ